MLFDEVPRQIRICRMPLQCLRMYLLATGGVELQSFLGASTGGVVVIIRVYYIGWTVLDFAP